MYVIFYSTIVVTVTKMQPFLSCCQHSWNSFRNFPKILFTTGKSTPFLVSTCLLWNNIVRLQLLKKKRPKLSDLGKEVWSSNVGKSKFAQNDRSHNLSPFFPTKHSGKPWGKSPSYLSPNSGCPQHSVGVGWPLLEAIVDLSRVLWCPLMSNNLLFILKLLNCYADTEMEVRLDWMISFSDKNTKD